MTFAPQRLLCLVDLSQVSAAVLSWSRLLAECYRTSVEVFHASWAPKMSAPEETSDNPIMFEVLGTEIEGHVNALAEVALGPKLSYQLHVVEGHPVKMVLQHMLQHPPDLVVLGSHGYDGFARVMLGSVAENVLRTAACPMLVVKGAPLPADVHALRTMVCAVDLGEFSRQCAVVAGDLANLLNADLHVAYATDPGTPQAEARSKLSSWIPDALRSSGRLRELVLQGDPAEAIVTYARSTRADLAVVAAEHRPFLEFTTLGRTTERVVRFCPCAVLVIPKHSRKPEFPVVEPANA